MDKETEKYIANVLREGTIAWRLRKECLNKNRRRKAVGVHKNGTIKYLWEAPCEICNKFYYLKDKVLEVDHIEPIGPFKGCWDDYINRMYCDISNLQAVCETCHARKTAVDVASMRLQRKSEMVEEDDIL